MSARAVAQAFIDGRPRKRASESCSTDGVVMRSYSMVIAYKKNGRIYLRSSPQWLSHTTRGHIREVEALLTDGAMRFDGRQDEVNIPEEELETAVDWAEANGYNGVARLLRSQLAPI
jgi:hypothetical protein